MAIFSEQLPLFPFDMHVLPGGKLPIHILEQRHIRMVKDSLQANTGFAVCMQNDRKKDPKATIHPIATKVKIIDFEPLHNNALGIIVEGIEYVRIDNMTTEKDGLLIGDYEIMPKWPDLPLNARYTNLATQYLKFLSDNPKLKAFYPEADPTNATWLAQRWLELLPFPPEEKQFVLNNECTEFCLEVISQMNMEL